MGDRNINHACMSPESCEECLRASRDRAHKRVAERDIEIARLRAQVEKLTAERDALLADMQVQKGLISIAAERDAALEIQPIREERDALRLAKGELVAALRFMADVYPHEVADDALAKHGGDS